MSNRSHGTAGRYAEGCKCDVCTTANTMRVYVAKEKRAGREPKVHNASTYRNWGCTCDICSQANRDLLSQQQQAAGRGRFSRKEWTDEELEVALRRKDSRRYTFTALQAALKLGRSVAAVNAIRSKSRVTEASALAALSGSNQGLDK
jgi:hypothetical protein